MMHKSLNNTYARSPCAYCKLHKCSLTVKQVRQKNCLGKQCWYLRKYPSHEWWKQREVLKQKKKQDKKENNYGRH
jgi:hypothetical protein